MEREHIADVNTVAAKNTAAAKTRAAETWVAQQGPGPFSRQARGPVPGSGRRSRRPQGRQAVEPETPDTVVLVSGNQELQDEVARLAAAAGIQIGVVRDLSSALALRPEVALLGSDSFRDAAGRSGVHGASGPVPAGGWKPEMIVVGLAADAGVWDAAAGSSAARVAVLPAAAGWLAGYLGRRRPVIGGAVLGVLGGCGGAGASTLACWLSSAAVDAGESVLLVDGDPWGAGVEWALGATEVEGIRWPDLEDLDGSLNPVQLAAGLPAVGGFSLLARGEGEPSTDTAVVSAVMEAARSGFGLTIVDLGRRPGLESLLPFCDQVLVVVPGRPGAVLAARAVLPYLGQTSARVVVRGPLAEGWDELRVAEAVGYRLAGYLPRVRAAGRNAESGRVLADPSRRRIGRATRRILSEVLAATGPVGSAA